MTRHIQITSVAAAGLTRPLWIFAVIVLTVLGCRASVTPTSDSGAVIQASSTPVLTSPQSIAAPSRTPDQHQEQTPSPTPSAAATPASPQACDPPPGWVLYTAQPGDALYTLAQATGTTVDALLAANCRPPHVALLSGQTLYLPQLPPTPTPLPPLAPQFRTYGGFEFALTANPQDERKTDITITNLASGEQAQLVALADVYAIHYHPCEYHNDSLYVIRRIGADIYSSSEWPDELWRYRSDGTATRLYSAQGLDFRAAPTGQYVALRTSSGRSMTNHLIVLDIQSDVVQTFTREQLSSHAGELEDAIPAWIVLEGWSEDGQSFWGALRTGRLTTLYRIGVPSYQIDAYNVSSLPIGAEYALNADARLLAYSDYPALFDITAREELEQSQRELTLFVYDLLSQEAYLIATLTARPFQPRWLDAKTLEYNDSAGNRLTFVLE